jgi:hypothetical protein
MAAWQWAMIAVAMRKRQEVGDSQDGRSRSGK